MKSQQFVVLEFRQNLTFFARFSVRRLTSTRGKINSSGAARSFLQHLINSCTSVPLSFAPPVPKISSSVTLSSRVRSSVRLLDSRSNIEESRKEEAVVSPVTEEIRGAARIGDACAKYESFAPEPSGESGSSKKFIFRGREDANPFQSHLLRVFLAVYRERDPSCAIRIIPDQFTAPSNRPAQSKSSSPVLSACSCPNETPHDVSFISREERVKDKPSRR